MRIQAAGQASLNISVRFLLPYGDLAESGYVICKNKREVTGLSWGRPRRIRRTLEGSRAAGELTGRMPLCAPTHELSGGSD